MIEVQNYIGGKHISLDATIDDISPIDETVIAKIPRTQNVEDAVLQAKSAQNDWSKLEISKRANWLDKIANALEERIEKIAELESLDTGKPYDVARNVDAARSVHNFRFFAEFGRN